MTGLEGTDIPGVVAARRQIDHARLLVAGMIQLQDVGSLAEVRGRLLRAARSLDAPAASTHPLAGAYVDGAAQARAAASLVGTTMVLLRSRLTGEVTPADAPVIADAMRRLTAALERVEAARVWAYAGTHP